MNNSAHIKEDGKYAKLPVCPLCDKKVHIDDNDANQQAWSFRQGDFVHNECTTIDAPNEHGEYWNGTEMVEAL